MGGDDPGTPRHARKRSTSLAYPNNKSRRTWNQQRQHHRAQSAAAEDNDGAGEERGTGSSDVSTSDLEMDDLHSDEGISLEVDEETGLTSQDRKRRRERKRRNTMLDERIAGDGHVRGHEEKVALHRVLKASFINALLIALWYFFSISISIYNKWMFSEDNIVFPYPLFTTCIHMLIQFVLASVVLSLCPTFRPKGGVVGSHNQANGYTQLQHSGESKQPVMTRWYYLTRIGPCGAATGLDIGLGNMSLRFISLTFFTMCKSSALAFVLLFAFLFRLEAPSWRLAAIIATMMVGVIMMVAGETAFNALGFILVMSSAFSSGFRWSLTQILLLRNPATSNPFSSIFFLAPVMFLSLLVIALPVENPAAIGAGLKALVDAKGELMGILILVFPGCLAFLLITCEFALLKRTSVVTLSICGIFKEVITISAAGIVFHDKLTPINASGLLITIASIAAYNYIKIGRMRDQARAEVHDTRGLADDAQGPTDESASPEPVLAPRSGRQEVYGNTEAPERTTTGGLIRTSLSIPSSSSAAGPERGATRASVDREARQSPVKRPEDLD